MFSQDFVNKATCNIISSLVLGQRFAYTDETFNSVVKRMQRNFQIGGAGAGLLIFPVLKYAPGMSKLFDEYKSNLLKNWHFVLDIVKEHRITFDRENLRDLIDACLLEIEKRESEGSDSSALAENNLLITILNLFAAGKLMTIYQILFSNTTCDITRTKSYSFEGAVINKLSIGCFGTSVTLSEHAHCFVLELNVNAHFFPFFFFFFFFTDDAEDITSERVYSLS